MPRVEQNKSFLNNGKNPGQAAGFKMSLQQILNPNPIVPPVVTSTPTPSITPTSVTPTPTPTKTKTPTPTPTVTPTPTS